MEQILMQSDAIREIFDYWTGLKAGRAAPLRNEIDPVALRRLLPHLFIVTATPGGDIVFRLAGTRICELMGREFRNMSFSLVWGAGETFRPMQIAESVMRYERPALLDVLAAGGDVDTGYELLLLPVRSEGEFSDRLLGALLPKKRPPPLTALPIKGLVLQNWTFIDDNGNGQPTVPRLQGDQGGIVRALRRMLPARFFGDQIH
jgi:hypothetical protein